ncbi:ATP-binding cassette domain-containing protein [Microbulbifer spongiae]|uniref:ATP-binding protein Uup n=1 Tax=Microbulbifer spongiae TaxID=2944933 RepID=A0ABY9EFW6_9GAMM|nr:ATP-binding cassette domain-containing protein [Microbulbifer sp. MI-G]WKD51326.1 ATP-binding cassette domain-containing protein [Microbulbifer sp. MI-G]
MLLLLDGVSFRYGTQVLAEKVSTKIERGDRICLAGRNGEGKSSLLRLITGQLDPDGGEIVRASGMVIAMLEQALPSDCTDSVYAYVAGGLGEIGAVLAGYRDNPTAELQAQLEAAQGWGLLPRLSGVLDRLGLDGEARVEALSGGWQRRAALARALVMEPDLLILDEPTNHLDIAAVEWLEGFLADYRGALLFVSHDRALARRLTRTVWDLDRGRLRVFRCQFECYQEEKEKLLVEEARTEALFDRKLAREEAWIRQGIKARRTRNEGRVRALQALRRQREARRHQQSIARVSIDNGERSGRLVAELTGATFAYPGEKPLVRDLSFTLMRGDKIGLIGPNGAGKSTLIRLLLGELQPQRGRVRLGTKQQIAYFDQHRDQLNPALSVLDNVAGGRDSVLIGGKSRHVMSYLSDFLFGGAKAYTRVDALSGGERNRVLLAKLFSQPANILVLDEPTNDLDAETLELLEKLLLDFGGTVLLVSHDRAFLDNVVGACLAFEGDGDIREYVGVRRLSSPGGRFVTGTKAQKLPQLAPSSKPAQQAKPQALKKKLSYKLQRELDSLPELIESLEEAIDTLQTEVADPAFFRQQPSLVQERLRLLTEKQAQLEAAFARWSELESGTG